MIRIHFTAVDFTQVRFAPRPAPLQELNTALMTMCRPDEELLFGRWRRRLLRSLPAAAGALADLVPAGRPPLFLDEFSDDLSDGLDAVRATSPTLVRAEIERVYAPRPTPPPPWIRDLHRGDADAWRLVRRAQHAAFETALRPVWPLVQDLHRREFTRYALTVAEHGVGAALTALVPDSRWNEGVWEIAAPAPREIALRGRGLVLAPTFHWTAHPLPAEPPDRPPRLTYPAGPGLPPTPTGPADTEEALAAVLGRTRLDILLLLADGHTTSTLARRLGVSNATASAHAAALRGAGLITTVRTGRSVRHERTALGSLLVQRPPATP
ncbi:winged helix-turn-helix domain-containing protein [Streptomyces sp. SAJ15]|uniref:winged helix-turn-helix domain-containing protein n=1 Tax=Streptomyces sp. SAJ15 TaxID=2011095 RepID=UPI001185A299|nr:winged helix-turn-helix domain-containing protein [Streptomyces sp. SAJ15]TVL88773.1 transcriptional regulator [Streptomyces sp. SAJ15]